MKKDFRQIVVYPSVIRNAIHTSVINSIKAKFPIQSGEYTAVLKDIVLKESDLSHNRQKILLLAKGNASDGVFVDIDIQDSSGKVVGSLKNHRIMSIPIFTNRYTFLVDGNEYNIVNQLRTKSGVYTRKRGNDTLESSFNLARGANFKLLMDPREGKFKIDILHTTLPMYAVLYVLGAPDVVIEQKLGKELFNINKTISKAQIEKTINTLYTKLVGYRANVGGGLGETASKQEKINKIREYFSSTEMDPETTKLTLGTPYSRVEYNTILDAAAKIVKVFNLEEDIDERDNLEFQKVYAVEDIVKEVLEKSTSELQKIKSKLATFNPQSKNAKAELKTAFSPVYFTKPLKNFITTSSISRLPGQINPIEMMDGAAIVTRLGEGAIQSERAVPEETRAVNTSYLGIIDPIATPESGKVGIDNRFSVAAVKGNDNELYRRLIDIKTGKEVFKRLIETYHNTVGFPDPLYMKTKSPNDIVPAVKEGKTIKVKRSELDYQIPSPHNMGTLTTNSIPFLASNQANRLVMGAKHIQQALPLKYRDTRLVDPTNSDIGGKSVYDLVGDFLLPVSPVDGVVSKIDDDYIYIKEKDGRTIHKVDYEHNLPLATKTMITNYLTVKEGDAVTKGQKLAYSNFTDKTGKLALGKNLNVAYMPYHGQNHEDGVVISESAAHKLTSEHTNKVTVILDKLKVADKRKYALSFPGTFTKAQLSKLDDTGVVKKGEVLHEGDPIILLMEDDSASVKNQVLGMIHKSLLQKYRDISEVYDNHYPAEVIEVLRSGNTISVMLKMEKPAVIGDKVSGSWGNKGVITQILPDSEMVHGEDGKPIDMLLTPVGVIGRINPAQILDTTLGKIALKTGKPYKVENFSMEDNVDFVKKEMAKHKVSDTETVTDPITGKKIPGVFTGVQHIYKLSKTTDSNFSARGIEGPHDQDETPAGSGDIGPKAIGGMEMNALIGHNARAILSENNTIRNTRNADFWRQFQYGGIYSYPQTKKTFNKFTDILRQAGINTHREGDELRLSPLTDKDVLELSSGEIKNALRIGPNMEPEMGGLFDPVVTGGLKGNRWGHIELAEPIINPVFEDSVRSLLGGTKKDILNYLYENGGDALKKKLNSMNLDKEIEATKKNIDNPKFKGDNLDKEVKKLKYLQALKDNGMKPGDAYMQTVVPVTPPTIRPIIISATGDKVESDSNKLYRDLIEQNTAFKKMKEEGIDRLPEGRASLYTRMKELAGTTSPSNIQDRGVKGALTYIAGDTPKQGFFQRKVIYSKMNLTGRATIAPDNTLGLDEIGIPVDMAWTMYKPFIIRKLAQLGRTILEAQKEVDERSKTATKILEEELAARPVLFNRAPTLWRHSMQAAYPKLREGKTLKVNTLWESALNADFDGDCILNSIVFRVPKSQNYLSKILNNSEKSDHYLLSGLSSSNHNTNEEDLKMAFTGKQKIEYAHGLINLEDFPRIEESKIVEGNKEKYKVPGGVEVLTVNNGEPAWLPVEEYSIHKNLVMVECETNTSRTVQCSMDHSLVTVDNDLNFVKAVPKIGLVVPRLLMEVAGHSIDSIQFKNSDHSKYQSKETTPLDYNFGWLNGAFIGDGHTDDNYGIGITKRDRDFRLKVAEIVDSLLVAGQSVKFGVIGNHHTFDDSICFSEKLQFKCYPLHNYFQNNIGRGAANKCLPYFWMETPLEFRRGLLAGLIDSDGTITECKAKSKKKSQWNISYTTISKRLAFELVALAGSLGLTATASLSKITESGNQAWIVSFNAQAIIKLRNEFELYHSEKKEKLSKVDYDLNNVSRVKYGLPLPTERAKDLRATMSYSVIKERMEITPDMRKQLNSIAVILGKVINNDFLMSRDTADRILWYLRQSNSPILQEDFWKRWASLLDNSDLEWEIVTNIRGLPMVTEAYDLTIPPAYTMVTESGWVVWDTETIHVPATPAAVEDAKRMLASKQVYSDKRHGDMLVVPKGEPMAGLYKATQNLSGAVKGPVKKYTTEADAWSDYYSGKLKATDLVEIGNK